jgi:Family of unknown function (DUF5681)
MVERVKLPKPKGRWRKGQSGNPGGRPAGLSQLRDLCRNWTPEVIEELKRLALTSSSHSVRVSAASVLLDRGWGKVPMAEAPPPETEQAPNVVRVPHQAESVEQWEAECVAWQARNAAMTQEDADKFMSEHAPKATPTQPAKPTQSAKPEGEQPTGSRSTYQESLDDFIAQNIPGGPTKMN